MTQQSDADREANQGPANDHNLARGLMFVHDAIGNNIANVQQIAAQVYALTETLVSKGVIQLHDLDSRKQAINQQMVAQLPEKWVGARMLADASDKYDPQREVTIACQDRVHLCKMACCKLGFFLSRQDLQEGIVRWDFARPYHIAQKGNGYCDHLDETTCQCAVRAHRPLTCRVYDCRGDKRIWADFDNKIPNPDLGK